MAEFPHSRKQFSRRYFADDVLPWAELKDFPRFSAAILSPASLLLFFFSFVFSPVDDVDQPFSPRVNREVFSFACWLSACDFACGAASNRPIHHFHDSLIASFTNRLATKSNSSSFATASSIINFRTNVVTIFLFSLWIEKTERSQPRWRTISTARVVSPRFEASKSLGTSDNWDLCCNSDGRRHNWTQFQKLSTLILFYGT